MAWYHVKNLAHVKNESSHVFVKKLWPMIIYLKGGQTSRSKSLGQILFYRGKGTCRNYSPLNIALSVITLKFYLCSKERQTEKRTYVHIMRLNGLTLGGNRGTIKHIYVVKNEEVCYYLIT